MGRTQKLDTVLYPSGTPVTGAAIAVKIVNPDGSQGGNAAIFVSETGIAATNPFSTGADGVFEIWANTGARYDIIISASGFVTRTVRWDNAYFPPADRSIGVVQLGIDVFPIGAGMDWWRPSNAVSVPSGWVPCDGRTLTAGNHDFPGGGSITVPDMRNSFVLGANSAVADGNAAGANDTAGGAPGIGGLGSSHSRNLAHTHTLNPASIASGAASSSTTSSDGAGNTNGSGTLTTSDGSNSFHVVATGPDWNASIKDHTHTISSHTHSIPNHNHTMPHTHQVDIPLSTSTTTLSATQDVKPQYVGWLKIIKVKNT